MINVHYHTVGEPDLPTVTRVQQTYAPAVGDLVSHHGHDLFVRIVVHYPWGEESENETEPFVYVVLGETRPQ